MKTELAEQAYVPVKCPKCESIHLELSERWGTTLVWTQLRDGRLTEPDEENGGRSDKFVRANCRDCGHIWKYEGCVED